MRRPELSALHILLIDDGSLARSRLRSLLARCADPAAVVSGEAAQAGAAHELLARQRFDVLLIDIDMLGQDGLDIARSLHRLPHEPALVFVSVDPGYAVAAFELEAIDYLIKPVSIKRLQQALQKAGRWLTQRRAAAAAAPLAAIETLLIENRGRVERVPLSEVLYLKSELKYVTVRTAVRSHILGGGLNDLERRYDTTFLRVHRNALVARAAIRSLEKHHDGQNVEGWSLHLAGIPESIAVSRRQLSAVRHALRAGLVSPSCVVDKPE